MKYDYGSLQGSLWPHDNNKIKHKNQRKIIRLRPILCHRKKSKSIEIGWAEEH